MCIKLDKKIKLKSKSSQELDLHISTNITYIYGSNGSGKTTISQQLDNISELENSNVGEIFFTFSENYINSVILNFKEDGTIKIPAKLQEIKSRFFVNEDLKKIGVAKDKIYEIGIDKDAFINAFNEWKNASTFNELKNLTKINLEVIRELENNLLEEMKKNLSLIFQSKMHMAM
ncbi:hypothetical protein [Spiroplasma clarkii]|uniref:Uncharacterized protein n=2 Tax=Spiroplasma clarkii TaxID=2139 RepID=A0A2K8KGH2_9MOLU|nr:hypothetical protein [Spiroplasma clarkii]ATX70778.1 hypothetical protein SCLAR_v1c04540 [Spiroplasma clarkii]